MSDLEEICIRTCPMCGGSAQAIDHGDHIQYREIGSRSRNAILHDMDELLRLLDLGDHARPRSPHTVMQEEIIPALRALVSHGDTE